MKAPVSMFVGLLLAVIIAALILLAVGIQWGDLVEIGDTYREYGNTRNIESNPYIMPILFSVLFLFSLTLFYYDTLQHKK